MKFAALGRTNWLYDSVEACVARGHELVLVATASASPEYTVDVEDFRALADAHGCPCLVGRLSGDSARRALRESGAEIAVSVNWPTLLRAPVLEGFEHGVLNAHAGDLPRYRGNAAPNWAIIQGEPSVTVTIHQMSEGLDAGDVFLKRDFALTDETHIGAVYRFMDAQIPQMFAEVLDGLQSGTITPRPQPSDPALSLRALPRRPVDSHLDWSDCAEHLCRLVRASSEPFAGAFTFLDGKVLRVWRAQARELPWPCVGVPGQVLTRDRGAGEVVVLTADGALALSTVQLEGGQRAPAAEVIRSTRARLGLDLVSEVLRLRQKLAAIEEGEND